MRPLSVLEMESVRTSESKPRLGRTPSTSGASRSLSVGSCRFAGASTEKPMSGFVLPFPNPFARIRSRSWARTWWFFRRSSAINSAASSRNFEKSFWTNAWIIFLTNCPVVLICNYPAFAYYAFLPFAVWSRSGSCPEKHNRPETCGPRTRGYCLACESARPPWNRKRAWLFRTRIDTMNW